MESIKNRIYIWLYLKIRNPQKEKECFVKEAILFFLFKRIKLDEIRD